MAAPRRPLLCLYALVAACILAAPARAREGRDAAVTVDKAPPVVQRRTFDRRNPPPDMPPLDRRTPAITTIRYDSAATVGGPVVSRRRRGGEYVVTRRIDSVRASLDATITVWVPPRSKQKWVDHEEGHRVIAERAYELADEIARHHAARLIGQTVTGTGPTAQAAARDALRRAGARFNEAYQDDAHGWSSRVGNRYDAITDHSQNQSVSVEDAIRQAFEQEPPPASAGVR